MRSTAARRSHAVKTETICTEASEGSSLALGCPAGSVISAITYASYGTPNGTCGGALSNGSCHAGISLQKVKETCEGKPSCAIAANSGNKPSYNGKNSKNFSGFDMVSTQSSRPTNVKICFGEDAKHCNKARYTPRTVTGRWLAAGAGLLGLGAVIGFWPDEPTAGARVEQDAAAASRGGDAASAALGARRRGPLAGAQLMAGRHALDYSMAMEAPDQTGRSVRAELRPAGELSLSELRADGWRIGRLTVAQLSADERISGMLGVQGAVTPAALAETFALRVDEDGAIAELRHDAAAPVGSRNLVSGLMHAVQVVQTEEDVDEAAWDVREPDTDGQVDATYRKLGDRIEKRWKRDRLAGTGTGADGNGGVTMLAAGSTDLTLERTAGVLRVERAQHSLDVDADLGMGGAPVHYRGEVRASLRRAGRDGARVGHRGERGRA